jgi:hypothetical protein
MKRKAEDEGTQRWSKERIYVSLPRIEESTIKILVTRGKQLTERGYVLDALEYLDSDCVSIVSAYGDDEEDTFEEDEVFSAFLLKILGPALDSDKPALVVDETGNRVSIHEPGKEEPTFNGAHAFVVYDGERVIIGAVRDELRSSDDILRVIPQRFGTCPAFLSSKSKARLLFEVPKPEEPIAVYRVSPHWDAKWTDLREEDAEFRGSISDKLDECPVIEIWRDEMASLTGDNSYLDGNRDKEAPRNYDWPDK